MRHSFYLVWLAVACTPPVAAVPAPAAVSAAPNFELGCYSASTATSRQVHCIRTDTRTGEIARVAVDKLPVSNGPTGLAAAPAGRYHTTCAAAASDTQADFYCVRLNTESGEMLLVNLTKVTQIP